MESAQEESFFKFEILIKSFEAFKRSKAIILLFITSIASGGILEIFLKLAVNLSMRGSYGAARFIIFIGLIIGGIIGLIGYTAAGKILMEYAKNKTAISIGDSLIFSLFSFYRFIISWIILIIIPIIAYIAALIYFFIAKIPDIGKLLAFIGLPAFTIFFMAVFFVILLINFMLAPMVYEGNNIKEIIIKSIRIYKKHATLLLGYFIFINIILFIVAALFIFLSIISLGLTSSILMITRPAYLGGMYGMFGSPMGGMMGGMGPLSVFKEFGAFIGFGVSMIYMLIIALLLAYGILGRCYIYLDVTSDMNFGDINTQFNEVTSKIKSNIDKYKEKASNMSVSNASQAGNSANQTNAQTGADDISENASSDENNAKFCPNCGAKNVADAKFCENCGKKLN